MSQKIINGILKAYGKPIKILFNSTFCPSPTLLPFLTSYSFYLFYNKDRIVWRNSFGFCSFFLFSFFFFCFFWEILLNGVKSRISCKRSCTVMIDKCIFGFWKHQIAKVSSYSIELNKTVVLKVARNSTGTYLLLLQKMLEIKYLNVLSCKHF